MCFRCIYVSILLGGERLPVHVFDSCGISNGGAMMRCLNLTLIYGKRDKCSVQTAYNVSLWYTVYIFVHWIRKMN